MIALCLSVERLGGGASLSLLVLLVACTSSSADEVSLTSPHTPFTGSAHFLTDHTPQGEHAMSMR